MFFRWEYYCLYPKILYCHLGNKIAEVSLKGSSRSLQAEVQKDQINIITVGDIKQPASLLVSTEKKSHIQSNTLLYFTSKSYHARVSYLLYLWLTIADKIIRVGWRGGHFNKGNFPLESKHQIILRKDDTFTKLIVKNC